LGGLVGGWREEIRDDEIREDEGGGEMGEKTI
jgi:hypothetical protein